MLKTYHKSQLNIPHNPNLNSSEQPQHYQKFHNKSLPFIYQHRRPSPGRTQPPLPPQLTDRPKQPKKKGYSQRHRPQRQLNQQAAPASIQTIRSEQFIFQGFVKNNQKHGQGIMLMKNGTFVVGRWVEDLLDGKTYIITSLGMRIVATFAQGKISGWTVASFLDKIAKCCYFSQNHIQGQRITYDNYQKMWVASKSNQDGKLMVITHAQSGIMTQPPSFVHSTQLKDAINRYIVNRQGFLEIKHIKRIYLSHDTHCLAFTDEEGRPSGLGVIFNSKQAYYGNFHQGILQKYGRIIFQNGDIYQGQMSQGAFWGKGIYYSSAKNTTQILNTTFQEQIIQKQLQGYYLIDVQPEFGKITKNSNTGIKGKALWDFIDTLEPYYIQHFVKTKEFYKSVGAQSLYQSEGVRSVKDDDFSYKNLETESRLKDNKKDQKPQKWIKFDKQQQKKLNLVDMPVRSYSVDKRQAAQLRKQNQKLGSKEDKQSSNRTTGKKSPGGQNHIQPQFMKEIQIINKHEDNIEGVKSLDLHKINLNNHKKGQFKKKDQINIEQSRSSGADSEVLRSVISGAKQQRKKIFY